MVLWDGKGAPPPDSYVPEFLSDAAGIIIKNGKPIIVDWKQIDPTSLPDLNLPESCKPAPPPGPCTTPCSPLLDEATGECGASLPAYVPKDPNKPVAPDTPLSEMVPVTLNFDGKDPDKAHVAMAKKNSDGSLVMVDGKPVIES